MNFKVGDWVTCETARTNPYKIINDTILKCCTNGSRKNVELWQPKEGEWCWFLDLNCSAVLAQYNSYDGENYEAIQYSNSINGEHIESVSLYSYCEPFIGN